MTKKIIKFACVLLLIIFEINFGFCFEKNHQMIKKISNETGINMEKIFFIPSINKVFLDISTWSNITVGCYTKYQSEEKKSVIRNASTAVCAIEFDSGLIISFRLANFHNLNDSKLGFIDRIGFEPLHAIEDLFCSKDDDTDFIYGDKQILGKKSMACINFIYENCVCVLASHNKKGNLSNDDLKNTDLAIKIIKAIIKNSVN